MTWLRAGNESRQDPRIRSAAWHAAAGDLPIPRALVPTLLYGGLTGAAATVAMHRSDYVLDAGSLFEAWGDLTETMVRIAVDQGLVTMLGPVWHDGVRLIDDATFLHMVTGEQRALRNRKRNDTRDPLILVPLLLRDGDQCRWCSVRVHWTGPMSNRTAHVDHLNPDEPATPDTAVVACADCNRRRLRGESWDKDNVLYDAPRTPIYGRWSAAYLGRHGHTVECVDDMHPLPGTGPVGAQAARGSANPESADSGDSPRDDAGNGRSGASETSNPPRSPIRGGATSPDSPVRIGSDRIGSDRIGTERDGPGRAGAGRDGPERDAGPPVRRPRRRRRRGR